MNNNLDFPEELTAVDRFTPFMSMEVKDEPSALIATDCRQEIKDKLKEIEKVRSYLKEPVLEQGKRIDAQAKKVSEPLLKIVKAIDEKLLNWHRSQEVVRLEAEKKKREEELARLAAEKEAQASVAQVFGDESAKQAVADIEKNMTRLEVKPIEVTNKVSTGMSTSYVQKRWKFAVTDPTLVPREYLMVDETKIGKVVTALKGDTNIPGVKVYEEATIGGRR